MARIRKRGRGETRTQEAEGRESAIRGGKKLPEKKRVYKEEQQKKERHPFKEALLPERKHSRERSTLHLFGMGGMVKRSRRKGFSWNWRQAHGGISQVPVAVSLGISVVGTGKGSW